MAKKTKKAPWILILLVLILALAAFTVYRYFIPRENPPLFQIMNYSGKVEVYSAKQFSWKPANRGATVGVYDKIRTGEKSDVDFKISDQAVFRLQQASLLQGLKSSPLESKNPNGFHLEKGSLLGYVKKNFANKAFKITTPHIVAYVPPDRIFLIDANSKEHANSSWLGVLRGSILAKSTLLMKDQAITVGALQKSESHAGEPMINPARVTRGEWDQMREGYELVERMAPIDQLQMDIAKQGGTLFQHVFDHGTFYTPKIGYAIREFEKDPASGEVTMMLDYDVFPVGSFVGVYLKTRNLNAADFDALQFEAQYHADDGFPKSMRIEFKNNSGVVRAYAARDFKPLWTKLSFPMTFKDPTPISEMVFVFTNDTVGEHKKGAIYLKNINLIPKAKKEPPVKVIPKAAPRVTEPEIVKPEIIEEEKPVVEQI